MSPEEAANFGEQLAALAHEQWSGWMKYLFSKCEVDGLLDPGALSIPAEFVDRWKRQMKTPYADLPEKEKESDRAEADKMLMKLAALNSHALRGAIGAAAQGWVDKMLPPEDDS